MNIKGFVRIMNYTGTGAGAAYAANGVLTLKEVSGEATLAYLGSEWKIVGVEKDLLTSSARFQIYVGAERAGKFEDRSNNRIAEYSITEFEDITVYALFDVGFFVFQYPKLRTRLYTPKNLINKAASFLEHVFRTHGLPEVPLDVPREMRSRTWFINRLLEVAKNPESRITEIRVTHIHDSPLSGELTIFNPDYTLEEVGRVFMPRANHGIAESIHKAETGNDLAKNPLVRAQVGAGQPERMVVKTAPEEGRKRERKTTYDAHGGELINAHIKAVKPKLPDVIEMLRDEFRLAYAK